MNEPENDRNKCACNYEEKNFDMQVGADEPTKGDNRILDMEVNILEDTKPVDIKSTEMEKSDPNLTDSSSSFDSTDFGGENGTSLSDREADSEFNGNVLPALPFDGYSNLFRLRKKKLTSNWRKYTGPLMWRCKWLELQIKKLESQAQKYDREIAEYDRRKHLGDCILENVSSKSLPFSPAHQNRRKAVMKRKKRRRVEETEDIASYMSHHNLFSYFEKRRSAAEAAFMDGNWGNQDKAPNGTSRSGVGEELLAIKFKETNNSLEETFLKIVMMQRQVSEMKKRVSKVLSESAMKFYSTENLSLLVSCNDTMTGSVQNAVSRHDKDKVAMAAPSNETKVMQEYDDRNKMGDVIMPESHGELKPETMKCTIQPAVGGSSRNPTSGILIYNRRPKKDPNKSKEANTELPKKPLIPKEEQQENSVAPSSSQAPEPLTPKVRSISEMMTTTTTNGSNSSKRKRAMRKAGSGKWTR